jgi:hypothetical protein
MRREDPKQYRGEGRESEKGRCGRGGKLILSDGINGRSSHKTQITLAFIHPWDLALLESADIFISFAWIKRC